MEEIRIQSRLKELEWLRAAVLNMPPCKSSEETELKVNNMTQISGEIARLERRLYVLQHTDVERKNESV